MSFLTSYEYPWHPRFKTGRWPFVLVLQNQHNISLILLPFVSSVSLIYPGVPCHSFSSSVLQPFAVAIKVCKKAEKDRHDRIPNTTNGKPVANQRWVVIWGWFRSYLATSPRIQPSTRPPSVVRYPSSSISNMAYPGQRYHMNQGNYYAPPQQPPPGQQNFYGPPPGAPPPNMAQGPPYPYHPPNGPPPDMYNNSYQQSRHGAPPPPPQHAQVFNHQVGGYTYQYSNCTGKRKVLLSVTNTNTIGTIDWD